MDGANVVSFERRRFPLERVELRLDENCNIEMTLYDERGDVVRLEYRLATKPASFDLEFLRDAWPRRVQQSSIAH